MRIDEDAFLADLLPRLRGDAALVVPPGDDCAALAWGTDDVLLVATDQVAADVHFHGRAAAVPTPPELVGRKLLARNLSDIAAMGGVPRWALVAIAAEADCPRAWLDGFMAGLLALAEATGVRLIGGDTGRATATVASLTILGTAQRTSLCRRNAARAGDAIVATGAFGGSLPSERHLTFAPRLTEGHWLAGQGWTRCMIDVSDGLLKDIGRICAAAKVAAIVNLEAIPRTVLDGATVPLRAALTDGEDYELLAAVAAARVPQLLADWPFATALTVIGQFIEATAEPTLQSHDGTDLTTYLGDGWRHWAE